jgi:hypothetical protein
MDTRIIMQESEKTANVLKLAAKLKGKGFRVFVSKDRGTHGFYTDAIESRIVKFQSDSYRIDYYGAYTPNRECGTGWALAYTGNYTNMLYTCAPSWVSKPYYIAYTTLADKLQRRGASFTEYMPDTTQ